MIEYGGEAWLHFCSHELCKYISSHFIGSPILPPMMLIMPLWH